MSVVLLKTRRTADLGPQRAPPVTNGFAPPVATGFAPLLAPRAAPPAPDPRAPPPSLGPPQIANLGPGYDFLGCAVEGEGDTVFARPRPDLPPGAVEIESMSGENCRRLSRDPRDNCCGIAAAAVLRRLSAAEGGPGVTCGVGLALRKGMPLGSGMGSSAASAAAAAEAVSALFGSPLPRAALVHAGLESEAAVSGWHADNIAPAVLGGFVLVRSTPGPATEDEADGPSDPAGSGALDVLSLPWGGAAGAMRPGGGGGGGGAPDDVFFVLVCPRFEAPTRLMRAAVPRTVPSPAWIANSTQGASLVAGVLAGDARLVGAALSADCIVEPARGPLIPGFAAVKEAALAAGARGCTISGAGPTVVAVVDCPRVGEAVRAAMCDAFGAHGGLGIDRSSVTRLALEGARAEARPARAFPRDEDGDETASGDGGGARGKGGDGGSE